jgi:hypothetical protein
MDKEEVSGPNVAARLHVMLARDAPFAVILRRGPSKQVCTIGWNLNDDTFTVGQWLKGRIYERNCDLSPDGQHLLYHAVKFRPIDGGWQEYTVLSRAPYLKAVKIWSGKGFYGGVWLDNNHFALHGYDDGPQLSLFRVSPVGEIEDAPELAQITDPTQWRFQRDGWKGSNALVPSGSVEWMKEFAGWELKLKGNGGEVTYAIRGRRLEKTFDCARWQWTDFRGERLLWAQDGKIFAAKIWEGGHGPIQQLADFNNRTFEPIAAPY